ncbi:Spy/CpxP family protein refolding chaperone [Dyella jiangningensis]|jgi:protein CpxP|uniref:Spy/CpxP family protein refolding chaperone n=1 Tax=Dyella jiangningensis TaxID=1379159 RepID=UPI00240EE9E8|nr:Spy/CpxP family protein refolding chaperone [Dyella jiangningensis]MDG2536578.1 Spy/CpxP family protein refolding chaperone [Dyella jiangningensis]
MRKNITLALAMASALALAPFAIAAAAGQDGGPHGGGHGGHGHEFAAEYAKLNLSDAQKANIKQIMQNAFSQTKTQRQNLRQQREAFEQMAPNASGYQAAAAALAQAEGAAATTRVQQRAAIRAQVYAVLTPAQQAQLATLKAERQARREQWQQFKAQHPASGSSTAQ